MAECNKIVADILKNCANLVPGIKDTVHFINIDDIDKDACAFDPDNGLLLTQLVLKTASPALKAYKLEGKNMSNEHTTQLVKKTYQKVWDHNFIFRVFDNTPEDKLWIHNAANSRFVVLIENNYNKALTSPAGRTVYEVLGWDFGLEINEAERDVNSDDTLGGWMITAGCAENLKESLPPLTLFVGGSLSATKAAVNALL